MILSLIIWIFLIFYLVRGYKLGLVHELLTLVGYLISWVIALIYANDFTNFIKIDKITSNHMLSNAISFFIIFILIWILVRWIKNFFKVIKVIPIVKRINALGGAIIALLISYMTVFLILNFALIIDNSEFNNQYNHSKTADFIVKQTPILSHELYKKWFQ